MVMTSSSYRRKDKAAAACDTCRMKKVRCTATRPVCGYCTRFGFRCAYPDKVLQSETLQALQGRLRRAEEQLEKWAPIINQFETQASISASGEAAEDDSAAKADKHKPSGRAGSFMSDGPVAEPSHCVDVDKESNGVNYQSYFYGSSVYGLAGDEIRNRTERAKYLGKSPLSREYARAAIPNLLHASHTRPVNPADISPFVAYFLGNVSMLYPISCNRDILTASTSVQSLGYQDNTHSCLIDMVIAIAQAYQNESDPHSGMMHFQHGTILLGRLPAQTRIEYVQAHVLSALFLLKKGRLTNFRMVLHTSCILLYSIIKRVLAAGIDACEDDWNSIQRMYWICYHLEREAISELDDTIPESPLYLLEQDLPLPLGCEEPKEIEMRMPLQIRMQYHFFLADTSLRMILARVTNMFSNAQNKSRDYRLPDASSSAVLLNELRQQLDEWEVHVPVFLEWSSTPGSGTISPVGTRLKLTYWFSRLQISRPAIELALRDQNARLSILEWGLLQQGVVAAINLVKTFVLEKASIDVLAGNR
ncbi:hypothetical protein BJY01DRAFT_250713 [Aspergillus pseudoustus]|uniref:Zn(2)-C6 fungal-type domain-containing protein n=1 Tax=Aspergillus pseudoustus TaxID=1810923 RepID=A0ABR4JG09_9EURO